MRGWSLLGLMAASCAGGAVEDLEGTSASSDGGSDAILDAADGPVDVADPTPDFGIVSLADDVQPIFEASCIRSACHDAVSPARGLALFNAGTSWAEMVDVSANQCPSVTLVEPGSPDDSYLIWKLDGPGSWPCFAGGRMPRNAAALTEHEIGLIGAWIAQGALDN